MGFIPSIKLSEALTKTGVGLWVEQLGDGRIALVCEIKWSSEKFDLDPSVPTLIEVPASESSKFLFPYYLWLCAGI